MTDRVTGWEKPGLTLRMSQRRRDLLAVAAQGLPPGATPTQAVDHALEAFAAAAAGHPDDDRLDALHAIGDMLDARLREHRDALEAMGAEARANTQATRELGALISAAADSRDDLDDDEGSGQNERGQTPMLLNEWMSCELGTRRLKECAEARIKARWLGAARAPDGRIAVDFEAALSLVEGNTTRPNAWSAPLRLDVSEQVACAALRSPTCLTFELVRSEQGWRVSMPAPLS